MLDSLFTWLTTALSQQFGIALVAALGWGVVSILLSPCHLSSIPLVIGYLSSQGEHGMKRSYSLSLVFALGILITIGLIGAITASAGRMMGDVGVWGNIIVAGVFFIVGLYLMDIISLSWGGIVPRTSFARGWKGALLLGLIFGIGLGPCTFAYMAPILAIVLAKSSSSLVYGVPLLLAYGLGHCSVIVFAGTFTRVIENYLRWNESSKALGLVKKICGILLLFAAAYMLWS